MHFDSIVETAALFPPPGPRPPPHRPPPGPPAGGGETRRYLVRAANTGITAVVDPRGRVLEATPLFDTTVLVRDVPLVAETTFYARHGDVFADACSAIALALVAASFVRRPHAAAAEPRS